MITLILLPGLDGTGLMFEGFIASFGQEVKTVVVNYPADIPLDYSELEKLVLTYLPSDEPYYLLAESFSGPIAISIAASSPPGLRGLILCCSFARNPLPLFAMCQPLIRVAPIRALPVSILSTLVLGRFTSANLRRALAKSLELVSPAVLRMRACAALSVNVSALLTRIKVPLLYLRASEDRVVYKASSELVTSLVNDSRIIEFTAPHFLLQVLPQQAASVVAEFMSSSNDLENVSSRRL